MGSYVWTHRVPGKWLLFGQSKMLYQPKNSIAVELTVLTVHAWSDGNRFLIRLGLGLSYTRNRDRGKGEPINVRGKIFREEM